jgi:hypothetical protein
MQSTNAVRFQEQWGDKPCDHPRFEDERDGRGKSTGNYICTQCGHAFDREHRLELARTRVQLMRDKETSGAEVVIWSSAGVLFLGLAANFLVLRPLRAGSTYRTPVYRTVWRGTGDPGPTYSAADHDIVIGVLLLGVAVYCILRLWNRGRSFE